MNSERLLRCEDLRVHFPGRKGLFRTDSSGPVRAVDGVSLDLSRGETLGVVGESGCGKTTAAMAMIGLAPVTDGRVFYKGEDITDIGRAPRKKVLALRREIQIIFQDPYSSLNPRASLKGILATPMKIHQLYSGRDLEDRIAFLLEKVGLSPDQADRHPYQFSGGQRQRIGIARALCLDPNVIIGDEPVSALDVSIQAQIINLLVDLQAEFNLSYLIISHDLAVVRHISDRIAVMYLGRVVETAPAGELYRRPAHPYSQALLSAAPQPNPRVKRQRLPLSGDVPNPRRPPSGCAFHPRCPRVEEICTRERPELSELGDGRLAACHFPS